MIAPLGPICVRIGWRRAATIGLLMSAQAVFAAAGTQITEQAFGQLADGRPVDIYTLESGAIRARITNYGGRIVSLEVPDRRGDRDDVVLGFDTLAEYLAAKPFFGALVGRYANRIAGGRFTIADRHYETTRNAAGNTLHGGEIGFDKRLWESAIQGHDLVLRYVSPDGEEGFPGTLTVTVRYRLRGSALQIDYTATTDQDTVLNLTNHSYFNLAAAAHGDVLEHELRIAAEAYTPTDAAGIPTGEIRKVAATPFDFRRFRPIGEQIADDALQAAGGYDQNFVLDPPERGVAAGRPRLVASVREPRSGRIMDVLTTEPGLQLYTANAFDGQLIGKGGRRYPVHAGFCLETQHFPDSPHEAAFPSTLLRPRETFRSTTIYRFGLSPSASVAP